jgi:hypothetical protein
MKFWKIIVYISILISCSGCINNNQKDFSDNAYYYVNIILDKSINYTIICPVALSLNEDPYSYNDYLRIVQGNGIFSITKISNDMPQYSNLSSTERGEINLYGLEIKSNSSISLRYDIFTNDLLVMTLGYKDYYCYCNSTTNISIQIEALSEPGAGQDYNSEVQNIVKGWNIITIEEDGWDN